MNSDDFRTGETRTVRKTLLLAAALLAGCATTGNPPTATIEWYPVTAAAVPVLCGHEYAAGCAVTYEGVCRIITAPMPLNEFTGYDHDMRSREWMVLGHEVLHCLGFNHVGNHLYCTRSE